MTQQYAVGGSRHLDKLRLSTDLSFTKSRFELINPILDLGIVVPQIAVSTNASGTAQLDYGGPNFDITTDEGFSLANWFDNHRDDNGSAVDWRADAEWADPQSKHIDKLAFGLRVVRPQRRLDRRHPRRHRRPARGTRLASEFPGLGCVSEPMASGGPDYIMTSWFTPVQPTILLSNTDAIRQAFTGTTAREAPRSGHVLRHVGEDLRGLWAGQPEGRPGVDEGVVGGRSACASCGPTRTSQGNLSQDTNNDGRLDYTAGDDRHQHDRPPPLAEHEAEPHGAASSAASPTAGR